LSWRDRFRGNGRRENAYSPGHDFKDQLRLAKRRAIKAIFRSTFVPEKK
jgi:hypothetical protein